MSDVPKSVISVVNKKHCPLTELQNSELLWNLAVLSRFDKTYEQTEFEIARRKPASP